VRVNFSQVPKRPASALAGWPPGPARSILKEPDWHESERLFCQLFNNIQQPMSITTLAESRYLEVNPTFLSRLGYTLDEVIGHTSLELGIWENTAQREELVTRLKSEQQVRGFETHLRGANNQTLVWLSSADLIDIDGESCILIVSDDITDRKRSEEQLKNVSARLIRAQEEERNRIARELHDSLNQKLALLCVDIEEFTQTHPDREVSEWLNAWSLKLQDASADLDDLSHQLHPSKLDHLGFVPALESLCRELSGRRGLRIHFLPHGDRNNFAQIDKEVALCVYRVVQEALGNAIKHSGASTARVKIRRRNQILFLLITDAGKGFSVETARLKGRLGLTSMEERLRLANGELIIRSWPNHGTQIEARIPLQN
jgi:PAS domain S-box-containing protein